MIDTAIAQILIWAFGLAIAYLIGYRRGTKKTYDGMVKLLGKGFIEHKHNAQG